MSRINHYLLFRLLISLPCSFLTYALLGSYLAQSVLGDHDSVAAAAAAGNHNDAGGHGNEASTTSTPAMVDYDYLRHIGFAPSHQSDELLERIAELHHSHRGLSAADAELQYLVNASKLAMYGVDVHSVLVRVPFATSCGRSHKSFS